MICGRHKSTGCKNEAEPGFKMCKYHRDYHREYERNRSQEDKDRLARKRKERRWRELVEALEHYGGRCIVCGECDPKVLVFHHKDHDGYKHRQNGWKPGGAIGQQLRDKGYPDVFEILCANCHLRWHRDNGFRPPGYGS